MGIYYHNGVFRISKESKINITFESVKNKKTDSKKNVAIIYDKGLAAYANRLENILKEMDLYIDYVQERQ